MSAKKATKKASKPAKKAKKSTSKRAAKATSKSKYRCCVCDAEMTAQVESACSAPPVIRTLVHLEEVNLATGPHTVQLTCPNGHTCNYPCTQGSDV